MDTCCFAGDTPGFPVTIGGRGSIQLTSDLEGPNPNTHAIVVGSDDVGIDLNGFSPEGA